MLYLAQTLLPWLIAALALGLVVGWRSCRQVPRRDGLGWLGIGLALFVLGLAAAAMALIPGRAGLWFDTALLFVAWYLAGCCVGCVASGLMRGAEPAAVAAGPAVPVAAARETPVVAPATSTPRAGPSYLWQATKDAAGVTLGGAVPTAEARKRLLASAKTTFKPLPVREKLRVADGAPDGFATMAAAALAHLARLDRGVASLVDGRYTLTGVAMDRGARESIAQGLMALPAGFTLARADIALSDAAMAADSDVEGEAPIAGDRPPGLAAPRDGKPDDLKRIRGIGRQNETRLNVLGVWHFSQIAAWTPENALWVGGYLAFPGRIEREDWIGQAKALAAGDEAEALKRGAQSPEAAAREGLAPKRSRKPKG
jgi:predicted flap endonuclease-1-like 5' DNA nuclease